MIEKALHNIIPRSLVEEAKGAISFVDKRSGYEIRLFNGEKLDLPPSLRSMAVLSYFVEPGARRRTSGEAARKISCSRPNVLAVSLPSPAFIT